MLAARSTAKEIYTKNLNLKLALQSSLKGRKPSQAIQATLQQAAKARGCLPNFMGRPSSFRSAAQHRAAALPAVFHAREKQPAGAAGQTRRQMRLFEAALTCSSS